MSLPHVRKQKHPGRRDSLLLSKHHDIVTRITIFENEPNLRRLKQIKKQKNKTKTLNKTNQRSKTKKKNKNNTFVHMCEQCPQIFFGPHSHHFIRCLIWNIANEVRPLSEITFLLECRAYGWRTFLKCKDTNMAALASFEIGPNP